MISKMYHEDIAALGAPTFDVDCRTVGIDRRDPATWMQWNALPRQPAAEVLEDAFGEQDPAGRREQGKMGVLEPADGTRSASGSGDQISTGSAIASRQRSGGRTQTSYPCATTRAPVG
jgi:hypothetical protein